MAKAARKYETLCSYLSFRHGEQGDSITGAWPRRQHLLTSIANTVRKIKWWRYCIASLYMTKLLTISLDLTNGACMGHHIVRLNPFTANESQTIYENWLRNKFRVFKKLTMLFRDINESFAYRSRSRIRSSDIENGIRYECSYAYRPWITSSKALPRVLHVSHTDWIITSGAMYS